MRRKTAANSTNNGNTVSTEFGMSPFAEIELSSINFGKATKSMRVAI